MRFTKMEGCGNDYIYINGFEEEVKYPDMLAVAMSERHFGVGADGLVLILPSEVADFRMRMFNMDGSEGEMCGNAVRCIGKYVYERGMTQKNVITLETLGGIKTLQLHIQNDIVIAVTADMGEPILEAAQIPVISDKTPVIGEKLQILDKTFDVTCVSMGNPHGVIFVDDTEIMFIDENSKGTYTSSDVYNNVVYEGNLRDMSHEEMLKMFSDIILCFYDAEDISIFQLDVPENAYKKYNY